MASVFLLGFLLGFRHALEADHMLAVATLSNGNSISDAIKRGVVWGVGHTLTLLLIGGIVLYNDFLITERLGQMLEFAVGIMLVILGADLFRKIISSRLHLHTHKHADGVNHIHLHSHHQEKHNDTDSHNHAHGNKFPIRALLIGLMHGLAGSSVLILLTLKTVQSPAMGIFYILVFGFGSIISMALLSFAVAIPLKVSLKKAKWISGGFQSTVAILTLVLGVYIVHDIGITNRLLLHIF